MPPRLSVFLLGPFRVVLGGQPVTAFRYDKVRALFAYLVMEAGLAHRRDVLGEMLWPEQPEGVARGNLRQALATLRRALGGEAGALLDCRRDSVRLQADGMLDLDVSRFLQLLQQAERVRNDWSLCAQRLEAAIALYANDFLHDVPLSDCRTFEEWANAHRRDLHTKLVGALQDLAVGYEQHGAVARALHFNQRLIGAEPWQEEAHRRHMRLLVAAGQPKAALSHFQAYRQLLDEEVGVQPERRTQDLFEQIRSRELTVLDGGRGLVPRLSRERRRLTVVSCSLTAPLADPEELWQAAVTFRRLCEEAAQFWGGHLDRLQGAEARIYFGYPAGAENTAVKAVQAAVSLVERIGALGQSGAGSRISGRAGVHTGIVVVTAEQGRLDVVGNCTQLAAQLCHSADPGTVLVGAPTCRLIEGHFICQEWGQQHVSGLERGRQVYRVVGEDQPLRSWDKAKVAGVTPFIGRERELARLSALWRQAERGVGCGALVYGEAGIGKSRLVLFVKERLLAQGWVVRQCRCSPQRRSSPLNVHIDLFEQVCGFTEGDSKQVRLEKLEAQLSGYAIPLAESVPPLADLLGLDTDGRYAIAEYSPQQRRRVIDNLFAWLLSQRDGSSPVMLLVEDVHWADPSSSELLESIIARLPDLPLFVLMTARSPFSTVGPSIEEIHLRGLSFAQSEAVVRHVGRAADLSDEVVSSIVQQTDGVPLFIEQLTRTVLEGPGEAANLRTIPATLYDLLMLRIDRLGDAKRSAQLGASLGRQFSHQILSAVCDDDEETLRRHLRRMIDSELLFEQPTRYGTVYWFKHALIQEAAYRSQLRSNRQTVHARIAEALVERFPLMAKSQPELVAQHLTAAGQAARAVDFWLAAGRHASRRAANVESVDQLRKALELLSKQPDGRERRQKELEILLSLALPLGTVSGDGSPDMWRTYSRAVELSEELAERRLLFQALWGLWFTARSHDAHRKGRNLARELLHIAEQERDSSLLMYAHSAMAGDLLWRGELVGAERHAQAVESLYDPAAHDSLVHWHGHAAVMTYAFQAWVAWLRGRPQHAVKIIDTAVAIARRLEHPHSLRFSLGFAAMLHFFRREPEKTLRDVEEILALDRRCSQPLWGNAAAVLQAWARLALGRDQALADLSGGLGGSQSVTNGWELLLLPPVASAYLLAGAYEEGLTVVDRAIAHSELTGDRYYEAEFHRLRAECLLKLHGPTDERVERHLTQALEVARRQSARMLELRALVGLGRLWQRQGRRCLAADPLRRVVESFAEGSELPDLEEAMRLLRTMEEEQERLSPLGCLF